MSASERYRPSGNRWNAASSEKAVCLSTRTADCKTEQAGQSHVPNQNRDRQEAVAVDARINLEIRGSVALQGLHAPISKEDAIALTEQDRQPSSDTFGRADRSICRRSRGTQSAR